MAYIVNTDFSLTTEIEFRGGYDALRAHFRSLPATPLTANHANWTTGTFISPELPSFSDDPNIGEDQATNLCIAFA